MLDQFLQTGVRLSDNCFGLKPCGPYEWLITLGIIIGVASAGLVLFRRLRKPAVATSVRPLNSNSQNN